MVGTDGQVRILDFGIGCLLAETEGESLVDTMSTANSVNSGLDCSSPESIMDPTNLTPIGDQYSLGCVMYYCLTGQYPFPDGTAVEKMMAHQHKQPKPIKALAPNVPDGLIAVVERLMDKAPASRYANCTEVLDALRPFAPAGSAVRSRPTMTIPRLKLPPAAVQPVAPVAKEAAPPFAAFGRAFAAACAVGPQLQFARGGRVTVNGPAGCSRRGSEIRPALCPAHARAGRYGAAEKAATWHVRHRPRDDTSRRGVLAAGFAHPVKVIAVPFRKSPTRAGRKAYTPLSRLFALTEIPSY